MVKLTYSHEDLLNCAKGLLFGEGNAQLPLPPLLMFDEITKIETSGGAYGKGFLEAHFRVDPGMWFFKCHFLGDPVMPGCLGLDALWQMLGFFLGACEYKGRGRALSVGEVRFFKMIGNSVQSISYRLDIKRVLARKFCIGVADGSVSFEGQEAYVAKDLRVGLFEDGTLSS